MFIVPLGRGAGALLSAPHCGLVLKPPQRCSLSPPHRVPLNQRWASCPLPQAGGDVVPGGVTGPGLPSWLHGRVAALLRRAPRPDAWGEPRAAQPHLDRGLRRSLLLRTHYTGLPKSNPVPACHHTQPHSPPGLPFPPTCTSDARGIFCSKPPRLPPAQKEVLPLLRSGAKVPITPLWAPPLWSGICDLPLGGGTGAWIAGTQAQG